MEVVEAYRNGATARELAVKWKVSPGSVYYQAGRAGWSKKRNGDQLAREHARAVEAAEAVRAEPARREQRALKNLFAPPPTDDPEASDPAALARAATLASGRAMKGRLWNEARALAALAESYARLADRTGRGGGDNWNTPEPTEAEFEAVRRKVMGWDDRTTEPPSASEAGSEAPDGGRR
ncbi:MAG: hypothetical protein Q8K90_01250 [Brevundimonas sp.]|nr:hypothetical protein [Brevundimonas sp.]